MLKVKLYKVTYYDITSVNNEAIIEPYDDMLLKCFVYGEVYEGKKAVIVRYGGTEALGENSNSFDVIPRSCVIKIEKI